MPGNEAVLDVALRGFGLCQLPDYYVLDPLRRGALPKVRLLIEALKVRLADFPEYQSTRGN